MLKEPNVRDLFRSTFDFEPRRTYAAMAAAPPPENRPAIGTAFDYLARFWLKRRHPDAVTGTWQAVYGVLKLHAWAAADPQYAWRAQVARKWLTSAESEYGTYIRTGNPTDGLMSAALELAELDVAHRAGVTVGIGVKTRDADVYHLRALWGVMEGGDLKGLRTPMSLNPEFGDATDLVRGADADIVADGTLIDLNTGKSPAFGLKRFEQLAGYAALQRLTGRPDFRGVGVYLARYGRLLSVPADLIYGAPGFGEFLLEFRRLAEKMFGPWERSGRTAAASDASGGGPQ